MKVFAFNFFGNEGNTESNIILDNFLSGIDAKDTEVINMCEVHVEKCKSCTKEMGFESPHKCLQNDDMNALYPKIEESDLWVFAFPYNVCSSHTEVENLLDRFEPIFSPLVKDGSQPSSGKVVFISTCSCWDKAIYAPVLDEFKDFASVYNREFAGAILRPDFAPNNIENHYQGALTAIYHAAKDAGSKLVELGKIPADIIDSISSTVLKREPVVFEK
jgi:hypothetical protein